MCISQILVLVLLHVGQLTFSLYSHTNALVVTPTVHEVKPTDYECHFLTKATVVPTHYTALTGNKVHHGVRHT